MSVEYEYSRHSLDPMEGKPRRKISEQEAVEHAPDGYTAAGEPYWNYRVERRVKAGPWEHWEGI